MEPKSSSHWSICELEPPEIPQDTSPSLGRAQTRGMDLIFALSCARAWHGSRVPGASPVSPGRYLTGTVSSSCCRSFCPLWATRPPAFHPTPYLGALGPGTVHWMSQEVLPESKTHLPGGRNSCSSPPNLTGHLGAHCQTLLVCL